jgi:hypothetical protein
MKRRKVPPLFFANDARWLRSWTSIRPSCSLARRKKTTSGNRSSAAKPNAAPKNIDEYLARVPQPARGTLQKVRAAIRSAVPSGATETISYNVAGSIAGGSFSTPFHPTGRPLTASFTDRNSTMYINCR